MLQAGWESWAWGAVCVAGTLSVIRYLVLYTLGVAQVPEDVEVFKRWFSWGCRVVFAAWLVAFLWTSMRVQSTPRTYTLHETEKPGVLPRQGSNSPEIARRRLLDEGQRLQNEGQESWDAFRASRQRGHHYEEK